MLSSVEKIFDQCLNSILSPPRPFIVIGNIGHVAIFLACGVGEGDSRTANSYQFLTRRIVWTEWTRVGHKSTRTVAPARRNHKRKHHNGMHCTNTRLAAHGSSKFGSKCSTLRLISASQLFEPRALLCAWTITPKPPSARLSRLTLNHGYGMHL